jgi:hypothetical protein
MHDGLLHEKILRIKGNLITIRRRRRRRKEDLDMIETLPLNHGQKNASVQCLLTADRGGDTTTMTTIGDEDEIHPSNSRNTNPIPTTITPDNPKTEVIPRREDSPVHYLISHRLQLLLPCRGLFSQISNRHIQ